MSGGQRNGVFLSYARADGESLARALHERIARELPEIDAKFDRVMMRGGVSWWQQIEEEIDSVEILVLLMTPAAFQSETVRREWRHARQRGTYVYPVKCSPDLSLESAPQWMKKAHFYDLDKEWKKFSEDLKVPRRAHRVPFMAEDLPESFVQRPNEFDRLKALLTRGGHKEPLAITTAVKGAGGYGKTTLARALCHDEDVIDAFDDGILWVTLGQSPDLVAAVVTLYAAVTGERPGFAGVEDARHALADVLKDKNALLVLDDVWFPEHVEPFQYAAKTCGLLVTTRQAHVAERAKAHVKVDEMTIAEATELLSKGLDRDVPAAIAQVARRLGEWPLLLGVARGTIRRRIETGDTIDGAIAYVRDALDEEGPAAFDEVERSIGLSLRLLSEETRRRFFELSVFREDVAIPIENIVTLWSSSRYRTEKELERLHDAGLIELDLARGVRVHDVLREYAGRKLSDAARLHERLTEAWKSPGPPLTDYAWRWLAWHLKESGRTDELRKRLFDFDWMARKLTATDINSLIHDYGYLEGDEAARLLQDALRLSANVVAKDQNQFAAQLLGRLLDTVQPDIVGLLEQAKSWRGAGWLRPLTRSLTAPGGPLVRTLVGSDTVWRVVISPDGRRAISTASDGVVAVWDLETGAVLRSFENRSESWAHAIAITPDGRHVLSVYENNLVRAWDLETGQVVRTFAGHDMMVSAIAMTTDGRSMISASLDESLKIWDFESGKVVRTLTGHSDRVVAVAVTPDGRRAISASDDMTLMVWDLANGAVLHTLPGHGHFIGGVAVSPDGRRVVSASEDQTAKVWDLESGTELRTFRGHTGAVGAVAITPDGEWVISGSSDESLKIWTLESGSEVRTLHGHTDAVCDVAVAPDGRRAISASMDHTLKVWNIGHGKPVDRVTTAADLRIALARVHGATHGSQIDRGTELRILCDLNMDGFLAVTPDGRYTMARRSAHTIGITDVARGVEIRRFKGFPGLLRAAGLTPDGRRAVVVSDDGTVTAWDCDGDSDMPRYQARPGVKCLLSPDGRWVIALNWSANSELIDLNTEQVVRVVTGVGTTDFITLSHDGRCVLCSKKNETLDIFDLESGARLYSLKTDSAYRVQAVKLTAGGGRAVISSYQHLSCWDLESGNCLGTFIPERPIRASSLGSDARIVIAKDDDGAIHFLSIETVTPVWV